MRIFKFIVVLLVIGLFLHCKTTNRNTLGSVIPIETNTLEAYGEKIYLRENCANCHTQQIEKETAKLFSLDGVGGKYSSEWLYYYLHDPKAIIPHSEKPRYLELYNNTLSNETLLKIAKEKGVSKNHEKLWGNMKLQAESLSEEINTLGATSKSNAEVVALISFIQQIPASEAKLKHDSIYQSKYAKETENWGDFDSAGILMEIANDQANSSKGKELFETYCVVCHGMHGQGGVGPNLTDEYWLHGGQKSEIASTIIYGVFGKGMISWRNSLTPTEVGELVSFIASIKGSNPENAKAPQGEKETL